ncbi:MAG TPA: glycosyltransferase family 2 protein [Solirubrobacteraceae bacterium]|nr:glycosyltransferase family 2 protein [Solirubrobacteraceae bacterium]
MVTFRGGAAVARALDSLARAAVQSDADAELDLVIVDNASRDGTADRARRHAPAARLIESPENIGFAAAVNLGIGCLPEADVIVLLNPDVEVRADFLERLVTLDWPSNVAARGPQVLDEQGQLEQSARGFPRASTGVLGRSSWLARVHPRSRLLRQDLLADARSGAQVVDWVSGACMIAPADRFRAVGPLDEHYFMYWEDADWCLRAARHGYQVVYEPSLVVTHRQGSSSADRWIASTVAFHRSALRYWRVNVARSPLSVAAAAAALTLRCILKLGSQAIRRGVGGVARRGEP